MTDIRFLYDHDEFKAGQVLTGEEDLDLDKLWAEDIIAFVVPGEPKEVVEVVEAGEGPELDLGRLNVKELKAKAKELGLSGYSKFGKDELIAAIEAAQGS